jgi:hypothetical protein
MRIAPSDAEIFATFIFNGQHEKGDDPIRAADEW